MPRVAVLALSLLVTAAAPGAARAGPSAVLAEARAVDGVGDVDAMRLGLVAVGARWRAAPTLDVQATALALATRGMADLGDPAAGGFGGELAARITPWPDAAVRPHARASLGGLLFPGAPFLPGGDVYEAIITFGAGAEVSLGGRWRGSVELFTVHLSNGQGLGPFNPAYDGVGATLAVGYALASGPVIARPAASLPSPPPLDLVVDASLGAVDDAVLASARARPGARLTSRLSAALDLELGSLADVAFAEAGVDLVAHAAPVRGGVHLGYRRYAGIDTAVVTAQLELRVTPELDLVAMGHHERPDAFDPVWRAGAGLRLAPTPSLTLDLGVGFDRLGDPDVFGDDHADPYLGVEWRSPWGPGGRRVALFVERQISTVDLVGVRLTAAAPAWRRVR
jgi:hypothetical protein